MGELTFAISARRRTFPTTSSGVVGKKLLDISITGCVLSQQGGDGDSVIWMGGKEKYDDKEAVDFCNGINGTFFVPP